MGQSAGGTGRTQGRQAGRLALCNSTQELGDFIFSVINAARLYKLNPDNALEKTNQKFIRRFNYVEDHSLKQGKNLKDMSLEEMDKLWDEAKLQEKKDDK